MTEKHYGGASAFGAKSKSSVAKADKIPVEAKAKTPKPEKPSSESSDSAEEQEAIGKILKAGQIASQARAYALTIVKKDVPLVEIAEKVEAKIRELGGKPAFPMTLSINEIAAHDTPSYDDTRKAHGLIKVDLGVEIDGFVADTETTVDLENSEINKNLIAAAQKALENALSIVRADTSLTKIGATIEETISKQGFVPVHNLSGHSIDQHELHSGLTIPNYNSGQTEEIGEGLFAIEPFVTNGRGAVRDGRPSGIYVVKKAGNVRDTFARQVLAYIAEEFVSLPFCSRWIVKKFGTRALVALRQIETTGIIYQYPQLIEEGKGLVAQAEHTILIRENKVTITTK
jgi:methionyl aminopeptidase